MNHRRVLLLDQDGVVLDGAVWASEIEQLAQRAFVSVLGANAVWKNASWATHHKVSWQRVWERGCQEFVAGPGLRGLNMTRWWDRLHSEWITETCATVGVEPPPTFEQRVDAAERVLTFLLMNSGSIVPTAASTITALTPSCTSAAHRCFRISSLSFSDSFSERLLSTASGERYTGCPALRGAPS